MQRARYNGGMAVEPCEKCGKPRSSEAVVCPHCGARRGGGGGAQEDLGKHQLSQAEIQALLLTSKLGQPQQAEGVMATLVLPHPGTEGAARLAEVGLTVLCAPLIAVGAVALGIRNRGKKKVAAIGEVAPVVAMVAFGSFPLDLVLSLLGAGGTARLLVGVGSIAGLCVRAGIRTRAGRRGRAQLEV